MTKLHNTVIRVALAAAPVALLAVATAARMPKIRF